MVVVTSLGPPRHRCHHSRQPSLPARPRGACRVSYSRLRLLGPIYYEKTILLIKSLFKVSEQEVLKFSSHHCCRWGVGAVWLQACHGRKWAWMWEKGVETAREHGVQAWGLSGVPLEARVFTKRLGMMGGVAELEHQMDSSKWFLTHGLLCLWSGVWARQTRECHRWVIIKLRGKSSCWTPGEWKLPKRTSAGAKAWRRAWVHVFGGQREISVSGSQRLDVSEVQGEVVGASWHVAVYFSRHHKDVHVCDSIHTSSLPSLSLSNNRALSLRPSQPSCPMTFTDSSLGLGAREMLITTVLPVL